MTMRACAVVPMAGLGKRFSDAGYSMPKFMLQSHGRTLLEWALLSLPLDHLESVVFVALEQHLESFPVLDVARKVLGASRAIQAVGIPRVTRGQAETVLAARNLCDGASPLIIYNIDTYSRSRALDALLCNRVLPDGFVTGLNLPGEHWSFARVDIRMRVSEVAEKRRISDWALTGLYGFSRASDFFRVADEAVRNDLRVSGEYFVAPLYNALIESGADIRLCPADDFVPIGTPSEYDRFLRMEAPCLGW